MTLTQSQGTCKQSNIVYTYSVDGAPMSEEIRQSLCAIRTKNGNRRYKYLVIGREDTYFVKEHSDSNKKYTEDDIIRMLEFLIDNIFVVFGGTVFQQIVGIHRVTNCTQLLADLFIRN